VTAAGPCVSRRFLSLSIDSLTQPRGRACARTSIRFVLVFLVATLFPAARITAQSSVPAGACLYALDSTAAKAFQIAGAQSVYTACGVVSESNSSSAFEMEGAETLYLENHAQVSVVGSAQLNGQTYLYDTINGGDVQAVQVTSPGDPLSSISAPTTGTIVSASHASYDSNSKPPNNTLSPGIYCGGLTIGNTNGTTFTFSPGVYIMAGGGLTLNSQAVVSGIGVTFYNTSSSGWGCSGTYNYTPVIISGQVTASLTAPTSGSLNGILFFGNRTGCSTPGSCTDQINGGSTAILNGALYFKSDKIEITGSNASGYTMLVADKIYINGSSNFGENGSPFDDITVSVNPASVSLYAAQTQQFTATVNNSGNTAVTWSISPTNAGSINSSGLYTAPSSITTQQTVTVTATSQADSTKSASATITLYPPINVSVLPTSATLYSGQTQQFTATVTNASNTTVLWSISPAGVGSISTSGLYTAPASITTQQTVTITAISQANSSATASATVTLTPPITVGVSPATATLYGGGTQQFTADVSNTGDTTVTWSISPVGVGSISASGLYTAPASISIQQTVTITATSSANSSATATATITLLPQITVSISPNSATLNAGQTQQFSASVTNTSNTAVTWSISPAGTGSISSSGLYTAPASIASQQTVTITATSQANASIAATATITLTPATQCGLNGYSYVRAVTISHAQVPNTDQINFPFLFSTTDPLLATAANGGHVQNTNGYDMIFTSDAAGQSPLNYEIEEYNPATGQVIAWVQIPTLSHTTDTTIYLFYGNSSVTASQQNPTKVWDANYLAVWHVPNGTQLSLADSTANGNGGTNNGATATAGQIDGGMSTNGSTYATIGTPADLANLAQGNATFSAWVNAADNPNGGVIMAKDDANISSGWTLGLDGNNDVDFSVIYNEANFQLYSQQPIPSNQWNYVVVTLNGTASQGQATVYVNGVPSNTGSGGAAQTTDDSADVLYLANATFGDAASQPLSGLADEFRISNTIRSADWIATEYANQNSPSTFFSLSGEGITISPISGTLYASETQQFTATTLNSCVGAVGWTISPAGLGSITQSGLYTAPATISTQQMVTITAASQTTPTDSASATITLLPPVSVGVSPATATITNGSQQQQFAAAVTNTANGNMAVTWSASPSGTGTIDQTGLYTAPGSITSTTSVTITATSQFDPTKSASATITLTPPSLPPAICAPSGYSFERPIVISHLQVPNTDQANFPFLFNSTDPTFATTFNGGHMANVNADDLIFTTDPAGQNQLNYQLEEYNPVTGQIVAWIQIPNLSHTTDTVLYMFYGNAAIASSQQNPTRVWDANYMGVWHVPNGTQLSLADSTSNGDNGTDNGAIATAGQIDGGMATNGSTYATLGAPANLANLAHGNATFSAWINPGINPVGGYSTGMILGKAGFNEGGWTLAINEDNELSLIIYDASTGSYSGTQAQIGNGWSYVVATINQSAASPGQSQVQLYVNGELQGTNTVEIDSPIDDTPYPAYLANNDAGDFDDNVVSPFGGAEDEFRISNTARSMDWIDAEYNNQSSPSSFYQLYPENTSGAVPNNAALYAAQTEQFTVVNGCGTANVTWSMPAGAPGTLTEGGLYTAPSAITTQQSIAVTATSQTDGSVAGTATISLMPPVSMSVAPSTATIESGQNQQFTATITNLSNTSVIWSISPSYLGSISSTGLFTSQGTIQPVTVTVTATSQADPTLSASATVTVLPNVAPLQVDPPGATLSANQTAQFSATNPYSGCSGSGCANWSISPAGLGSIDSSGVYTAPATINTEQTVLVTATALVEGVSTTGTAVIGLIPNTPTVTVQPATTTLTSGQSQQYVAAVTNSSNTAVTWSMSPSGYGTLSATGLYTAPPVVTSQQTITITATSQQTPSLSGSAVLTLMPTECAANAYSYERAITIDHTKVPNSDQVNFPFYFAVTDPTLASTANGGHMASGSGYDLEFSSDPAGLHLLNYQLEQYNPATGQIEAWVGVPNVSHSSDTVIYMFYGNSNITVPQQNPSGVWDGNYAAVYQFDALQSGILPDLTANENNATTTGVQAATGIPGEAGDFNGLSSFVLLPTNDFASYPASGTSGAIFNATFSAWFKTSSWGTILGQTSTSSTFGDPSGWVPALYIDTNGYLRGSFFNLKNAQQMVSSSTYNDNNWHHVVLTFDTDALTNTYEFFGIESEPNGIETLYVDGQVVGSQAGAAPDGYSSSYTYTLGDGFAGSWESTNNSWFYLSGALDQVEISSTARSGDWVRTEYLNQSSPATFFALGAEAGANPSVNPISVTLYGSESQQLTVLSTGSCSATGAAWSMPIGSPGTLSPTGFYTAPATIDTQQTVSVAATTLGANSTVLTTTITLMPPVALTVAPGVVGLPVSGTQQFTATVTNANNTGVTWSVDPAGIGSISPTGLYTAPSTLNGQQAVSVIATSLADATRSASATVTLGTTPAPTISINPLSAALYPAQTEQFTTTVTNVTDSAVTWSISPAGTGSIDLNGVYTAPDSIGSQQTVTVTATSQSDPSLSASATVILLPTQCGSNGYGYVRSIIIDHTKVPNTDQTNFPFLFSTIDPLLATTTNGGHLANSNGYDVLFTSDAAGQNALNYEIESYNPATGQLVAWVRIPTLSHTADTVIYLFYGNPQVTASQQSAANVWDSNYKGVWHLGNGSVLSLVDSTSNANNATNNGALATAGPFGGGMLTNGSSYATIGTPSDLTNLAQGPLTLSVWVSPGAGILMGKDGANGTSGGWALSLLGNQKAEFVLPQSNGSVGRDSLTAIGSNAWSYITFTLNGSLTQSANATFYINGVQSGTGPFQGGLVGDDTGQVAYLANAASAGQTTSPYSGSTAEFRISNTVRSSDWIATEYNNQGSPSTFFTLSPEGPIGITPPSASLYANQSEQFAAPGLCSTGVTWSLSAGAPGTLTPDGLYTAPTSITEQQILSVTATTQSGSTESASATITLLPSVTVAVSPASFTLNANQTQQFTATVDNTANIAVIWTISPAGVGSIDQTGGYIAPSSIDTQQTVTITATSQADPTKSASAMITLAPSVCASTGYGYQRVIVIDHTKVANSDQVNFPFLFNTTDPDLATVDHGGHVANPNGYDIIFSTSPNGQTKLDFEVEQYNPATGQLVAWIRIPNLSHSADTVIYAFYGNPAITTLQANPTGVWDSNYQAVYHLGSLPSTDIATDSTNNTNNAPFTSFTPDNGRIDGAAALNGASSYMQIPSTAFPSYPVAALGSQSLNQYFGGTSFSATFGIWFKTNSWGGLLQQTSGETCVLFFCDPEEPGSVPDGSWNDLLSVNFNGQLAGGGTGATTQTYNDNNWHYAVITFANGASQLYADGQLVGNGQGATPGYSPTYAYFVGTEFPATDTSSLDDRPWIYWNGAIDEINVSNAARSGDWIETQYNNQSSPSTFYKFYAPSAIQVVPSSITLLAGQTEQFAVPATCDATITWSLPSGSLGTLSSAGLYTAPTVINGQQTATVNATSQSSGAILGSAVVTLLPTPQPITLSSSSPSPYSTGSSETFTVAFVDAQNNPQIGVPVNFTVAGVNEGVGSATTDSNGNASFTYTGANSGTDTIQASASLDGSLLTSNAVTATWLSPPPVQAPTVTLLPQPSPGRGALVGAFTDNNGDVVEPIVVGTASRTFVTPAGATRLQLGINDNYYEDNGGAGFVVKVNGLNVTIPPTTMPWNWQTGTLNNSYQYGVNDGSNPIVAAASLTAGEGVTIAYQSGTVSTDFGVRPLVNANGEPDFTTGTQLLEGAYFPTLYTTGTSYPENQPVTIFAAVADATGAPIANAAVTLNVSGANPGQYQATSDSTGTAAFIYSGQNAGNDSLQAQTVVTGQGTLDSSQASITWVNYPTPPTVGSLSLNEINISGIYENYAAYAKDPSGNPVPNANVGFYITGVDSFQSSATSDDRGEAYFVYTHTKPGNYRVIAVDTVDRNVIITQPFTNDWVGQSGTQGSTGGTISIGISGYTTVTMPNALTLTGTVTDSSGLTPSVTWTEVSGPGTVTFANPSQASTNITFSQIGTYVLELTATDSVNTGFAQFTVTALQPVTGSASQGWIGTPAYGSSVSGLVPIALASGVSLSSGTLSYMPTNNVNNVTVLNPNVSGTGLIGVLDTTMLANGSYWIQMQATDANGNSQYSLVQVTVSGNYKPGRVTSTVTDLIVPSTGLAINIQRTYDSLNAGTVGDFGYGWNLGINVDLVVDPSGNVTFTLGGQRRTFYLAPQAPPCTLAGCLFPYYFVAFTPEPGLYGTLTDSSPGCPLDIVVPNGSLWECYGGSGQYNPPGYIYTDPTGTQYSISAGGSLQSITDRNGNGLTITASGITSTTGLNVPFMRDNQGRITQITDPQGNVYLYGYDENGNLASVTYPNTPQPSTYSYTTNHYYLSGTDFRSNPLPTVQYYASGETDTEGNPLAGKLQSVTDGLGETTTYAYDLSTYTTTITYPQDASGNVGHATMVYDSMGDVLSSTDPLSHTTTNTYNVNQNLLSATDPLGHTTGYTYDSNGNKTSQTYPATGASTNTTSYINYNQFSEPTTTVDELGNTTTFNYDANYLPQSVTDSGGTVMSTAFNANGTLQAGAAGVDISQSPSSASQFAYDANGDLTSKTDALGRTTSFTYDALGHKVSETEPGPNSAVAGSPQADAARRGSGRLTAFSSAARPMDSGPSVNTETATYQFDALGNMIESVSFIGSASKWQYDANNNLTSYTDGNSNTTTYQYDGLNRLILITYPDSTTISFTYDFRNNVVTRKDQRGDVTYYQYDLAGQLASVTQGYGSSSAATTSYVRDAASRIVSETDPLGHTTTYAYDAANNLTGVSGVKGTFTFAYDNARNLISATDGNNNTTQYQYDVRKRPTKVIYPDQTTQINTYNGHGDIASITDQAGNEIQYNYDAAHQLVNVVEVNSPNTSANTESYSYDGEGNLLSWTDPNGHQSTASYDGLGEPLGKVQPDGSSSESVQLDPNGNVTSWTHYNGATTSYTYDQLNRLLSRTTPSEAAVSYTYTPTGKLATTTDASGTTTYSYDSLDRLTSKATPEGTLTYAYDVAGHVASVNSSNSGGVSLSYTYDDLNRLSTVTDNRLAGQNTTTYTYDTANNIATVTYPNGVQSTFNYDQLNRVSGLSSQPAGYTYQRSPVGNLTTATESNGRSVNWSYDGINRLTNQTISGAASGNNGSVSYGLDPVGNRLSELSSLTGVSSGSFSFNADDQLSSEAYDQNGNVIAEGGKTFTYDSQNHLVSMNGAAATFVYDALGNRVAKTVDGVTTHYLVDDLNPTGFPQVVEELNGSGAVTRMYSYGWKRISENQVISNQWTPSFYIYDGRGDVRQLTNSAGAVTDSYEYDAFGHAFTVSGSTPNNYLYNGEQYDPDLALYYQRARYYNPASGRFVSQDLYPGELHNLKSLHRYQYTGADPVNYVDPDGMDEVEVVDIEAGVSTAENEELAALGKRINCLYGTAAAGLDVIAHFGLETLINFSYNLEACSATGEAEEPEEPNSGGGSDEGITCPLCFAAGTPVHTNHGDVPIEKVQVGDEVVARDSKTGKLEMEPVTALTPLHKGKLLEIRVEGERDTLRPSVGHPFWARRGDDQNGQWMEAEKLRIGDLLETPEGNWRRITSITPIEQEETVYNFTVAKDHDYFVGQTGFLVHNAGSCPCNLRYTDRMSNSGYRRLLNDIQNNGILNNVISFVPIGGANYVLCGNNRLMAARQLGLADQLEFEEVQLPFLGFQSEEDVINAAADFMGDCGCSY